MREALREFARREIDVLAINGGDGTVARVLGELVEGHFFPRRLPVALLPGGTANMTSDRLGVRGSLPRAARRLFDWSAAQRWEACQVLRRPILRVRFADGRDNAYGMFLGAGAVIQGTESAHRKVHARGFSDNAGLAIAVARTVWGLSRGNQRFHLPVRVCLAVDGQLVLEQAPASVLLVSSLPRLFYGVRPFWGQGAGPVRSTVIPGDAECLLRKLPQLLAGRPGVSLTTAEGFHSHRGGRLTLRLDGEVNLDGELHRVQRSDGPVTVERGGDFTFLRL